VLHQAVLLQNMPNSLCDLQLMEVVLEQAGLIDEVVECQAHAGLNGVGEVFLTMSSQFMADMCVRHFSGCVWDTRGIQVMARFINPGEVSVRSRTDGSMPEHVESLVGELNAAIGELTERVLEALLAPDDSGLELVNRKKVRPAPPGLETLDVAVLSAPAAAAASAAIAATAKGGVHLQALAETSGGADVSAEISVAAPVETSAETPAEVPAELPAASEAAASGPASPQPVRWDKQPLDGVGTDASTEAEGISEVEDDHASEARSDEAIIAWVWSRQLFGRMPRKVALGINALLSPT